MATEKVTVIFIIVEPLFRQMLLKTQFKAYLAILPAGYSNFNWPYLLILLSTSVINTKNDVCEPVKNAVLLSLFLRKSS